MKDKSGGVDEINVKMLKVMSVYIWEPLAYIFNLCIEQSICPNTLKKSDVLLIHKASDKHTASNYRPISLISNIDEILEKMIHIRILKFIKQNEIINEQ